MSGYGSWPTCEICHAPISYKGGCDCLDGPYRSGITDVQTTTPLPIADIKKQPPAKRRMRPGGGKAKGNGFESTIAKKLTEGLKPLKFIRTQGSGARVGGKNFATVGQQFGEEALRLFVGDVVPTNERDSSLRFLHHIETKFYATQDPFTALVANTANIFKWFQEAVTDAAKVDRNPMLICKWNHTPIFVVTDMCDTLDDVDQALAQIGISPRLTLLTYGEKKQGLDIFYLDDLLKVPSFWYLPT